MAAKSISRWADEVGSLSAVDCSTKKRRDWKTGRVEVTREKRTGSGSGKGVLGGGGGCDEAAAVAAAVEEEEEDEEEEEEEEEDCGVFFLISSS